MSTHGPIVIELDYFLLFSCLYNWSLARTKKGPVKLDKVNTLVCLRISLISIANVTLYS